MANNRYVMFEEQAFPTETFLSPFTAGGEDHAVDQVSEDISEEHGFVYIETSAKRTKRNRLLGPRVSGGEISVPIYTMGLPTLVYYALGSVAHDEPVTMLTPPNFEHKITPGTSIPPFRMAIGKDLKEHQFVGCAMKSLKIDYTVGDAALATFDLLVRKELAPGTLQTPTFPDYDVVERSFTGVEVICEVNDVPVAYCKNLSIEINNDLVEDNHCFGDRFLPNLRVQGLEVTGSIEMAFADIARYTDVLDEVEQKFAFIFSTGTLLAAGYRQFKITLEKMSFDKGSLPTDGNKEYIMQVDFTAEIDPAGLNTPLEIEVYNDESGAVFSPTSA